MRLFKRKPDPVDEVLSDMAEMMRQDMKLFAEKQAFANKLSDIVGELVQIATERTTKETYLAFISVGHLVLLWLDAHDNCLEVSDELLKEGASMIQKANRRVFTEMGIEI